MTDAAQALRDSSSLPASQALMLKCGEGDGERTSYSLPLVNKVLLCLSKATARSSPPACGSRDWRPSAWPTKPPRLPPTHLPRGVLGGPVHDTWQGPRVLRGRGVGLSPACASNLSD